MWALLAVGVVFIGGIGLYNGLVKLREQADAAWADIDVQLKRRHDLIPNVVETVKGYAAHEQKTLEAVVAARSSAMSAQSPAQKGQAEGMLGGALKSLFALAEPTRISRRQTALATSRAPSVNWRSRFRTRGGTTTRSFEISTPRFIRCRRTSSRVVSTFMSGSSSRYQRVKKRCPT